VKPKPNIKILKPYQPSTRQMTLLYAVTNIRAVVLQEKDN